LTRVSDAQVRAFWHDRFDQWSARERPQMIESVLNKVTELTLNPYLAPMLGADNFLNPRDLMDSSRILLVNLALDPRTKGLLGALLLSFFEMGALSRENVRQEARNRFYLFVDEAQKFTAAAGSTATFGEILSECRKYGLSLIYGSQGWDSMVTSSRLAAAAEQTQLLTTFAAGLRTAQILAAQTYQFDPAQVKHVVDDPGAQTRSHPLFFSLPEQQEQATKTIQSLKAREILVKLPEQETLLRLRTPVLPKPRVTEQQLAQIKRLLAKQIGYSRQEIEQQIARRGQQTSSPMRASSDCKENGAWQEALWQQTPPVGESRKQVVFRQRPGAA
jgi:hypothetical protein